MVGKSWKVDESRRTWQRITATELNWLIQNTTILTLFRLISCPDGPEIYPAGLVGYPPSFPPISIPRRHPPPLAQRERSTSAPNVCYNMVSAPGGVDGVAEDWSYRMKAQNLAGTGRRPAFVSTKTSKSPIGKKCGKAARHVSFFVLTFVCLRSFLLARSWMAAASGISH